MAGALTVRDEDAADFKSELESRLIQFNEDRAGPRNLEHLGLTIRDEKSLLLAGLAGELFWNALYVDVIWVAPDYRLRGYGRTLLKHAEGVARRRGRDVAYLSTFEFQAPGFYEKLGYSVIGELSDVPRGSRRIWLSRRL